MESNSASSSDPLDDASGPISGGILPWYLPTMGPRSHRCLDAKYTGSNLLAAVEWQTCLALKSVGPPTEALLAQREREDGTV